MIRANNHEEEESKSVTAHIEGNRNLELDLKPEEKNNRVLYDPLASQESIIQNEEEMKINADGHRMIIAENTPKKSTDHRNDPQIMEVQSTTQID